MGPQAGARSSLEVNKWLNSDFMDSSSTKLESSLENNCLVNSLLKFSKKRLLKD